MFSLYLITDGRLPASPLCAALARALHAAPAARVAVQLRAKQLPAAQLYELALPVLQLCRAHGVPLLINDRVDVALAVGADGVHLPEKGLQLSAARALLGERALLGVSCHDAAGLEAASSGGASFATLSPVFDSPGKGTQLGLARFAQLAARAGLPVLALGGVSASAASALRSSGAAGLAVISAVFAANDPGAALSELLAAWDAGH